MQRDPAIIFNSKLAEFIRHMSDITPQINDFKTMLTTCEVIVNIDYTLPIQIFRYCITDPYKKNIYEKNESFFLSQQYDEYSQTMKTCGYDFDLINQLKKIYKTHSNKHKGEIWNYMKMLCKLSEDYPIDSLEKINNLAKYF